jgi:hypothetical protein
MKKLLLATSLLFVSIINAQGIPIFDPSMGITSVGIVTSPLGEEVDKITDGDINTKFLDFDLADGMGFIVDLGTLSTIATYIEITTANDFPERDPIDFEVSGSTDGTNFTLLNTGSVICILDRFNTRLYNIINTNAYNFYRVNFTAPCDPSGGMGIPSIQLAEVQLYEAELGIEDNEFSNNDILIYPNPNTGSFTIKYSGNAAIDMITIHSISGQLIKTIDHSIPNVLKEVKLPNVATGLYFVQFTSNKQSVVKKIQVN